jgi:hypothetical protein
MMELKKKLEKLLERHTKKAVVSCDETCMCWEIEALLCDLDMQAEKSAQQHVQRTCVQCGADDWRDAIYPDTVEICNRCGASR